MPTKPTTPEKPETPPRRTIAGRAALRVKPEETTRPDREF